MPFAPKIRKEILAALEQFVIPQLKSGPVLQVLADPLCGFEGVEHWVERRALLPEREQATTQRLWNWRKEQLLAIDVPCFGYVFEGVSCERIGLTAAVARQLPRQRRTGIQTVKIPAPGIIYYPARVPHSDGVGNARFDVQCSVLGVKLVEDHLQVFLIAKNGPEVVATHNLDINDSWLSRMSEIYHAQLLSPDNEEAAQVQLLAFMCRLRYCLHRQVPVIANSSWVNQELENQPEEQLSLSQRQLAHEIAGYIQANLHHSLTLEGIAGHFHISRTHLTALFPKAYGITPMRYVTSMRIASAKRMLHETHERPGDIARLVGFSSVASFSTVFQRYVGCSPSQYRMER